MTVCIAAINETAHAIVTVNDMLLSDDTSKIEWADYKRSWLVDDEARGVSWHCLYSGLPTVFESVTEHVQAAIGDSPARSSAEMMRAVENAYDAVINRRIERQVLSQQYGIDFVQFRKLRRGLLFDRITEQIAAARTSIEYDMLYGAPTTMLVFGFDASRTPHIFSTDGVGNCTSHDNSGYHAIGAGGEAARAWLVANDDFRSGATVNTTAFRLCQAKFLSENSPFVGAVTLVSVLFRDKFTAPIIISANNDRFELSDVRDAWRRSVNQTPPENLLASIDDAIKRYSTPSPGSRLIFLARSVDIAKRRFDEADLDFKTALAVLNGVPPSRYRSEIYTAIQQSIRRAEAQRSKVQLMLDEWNSTGVRPAALDEPAIAFDVEASYVLHNSTNTITPLDEQSFSRPQKEDPEPTTE